jgi:hypothetical protein
MVVHDSESAVCRFDSYRALTNFFAFSIPLQEVCKSRQNLLRDVTKSVATRSRILFRISDHLEPFHFKSVQPAITNVAFLDGKATTSLVVPVCTGSEKALAEDSFDLFGKD